MGGLDNIVVSSEMLISASNGKKRYHAYLEEQRQKAKEKQLAKKHKSTHDEIAALKKRKVALRDDICELERSADMYAEKAETTRHIQFITKSNSLRRTCKEKRERGDSNRHEIEKLKE